MAVNRRMWDESVPLHLASRSYDVPSFVRGRLSILPLEVEELGPVRGRSLLHLQCHFGMDTLSWSRLGAKVTGVDFSRPAIAAAEELAEKVGIAARFVRSNVYDLSTRLRGTFDVVYTGKGAICWLPDLIRWAKTISDHLKPGGRLYFLEDHPIAEIYANGPRTKAFSLELPYFGGAPLKDESPGTYAAPDAQLRNATSFAWIHPISETLGALIGAGLRIDLVHEFPFSYWKRYPFLRQGRDGYWYVPKKDGPLPLTWSVRASKPRS